MGSDNVSNASASHKAGVFTGARHLFPDRDFIEFHTQRLPDLVRRHGALVAEDLAGIEPIGFITPERNGFTYRPSVDGIEITEGVEAAGTLARIAACDFSDFTNEIYSVNGLIFSGNIEFERGDLESLHRWEPALNALFSGRPIWTPAEASKLIDPEGAALDLARTFTLDDNDEDMRRFLETAGFLHVRAAFERKEIEDLRGEIESVRAQLSPGEGDCWWSTTKSGDQVVTRINYLDRFSERLRQMCWEPRVQRLGRLPNPELRVCDDRLDGPMVFVKNSDVVQGLGDLNWHQDDGLGGHPIMCPLMQVGIQLDHANEENGQLFVLAGSHRYSNHPMDWGDEPGKPVVRFDTEPGDLTIHFGDILHTTPPPTGANAGRRVMYFKFAEHKTFDAIPAGAHYNDLLFKAGAGGRVATRADTWSDDDTQEAFQSAHLGDED